MAKKKPSIGKGFQFLAMAMPLLFMGPAVFNSALKNKEHSFFIPILSVGLLILILSVFIAVKGIRTIVKALFEEE